MNLKFRVWNPTYNSFEYMQEDFDGIIKISTKWDELPNTWVTVTDDPGEVFVYKNDDSVIPLLFTGLYDSEGKEIYDGDILEIDNSVLHDTEKSVTAEVQYIPPSFVGVILNKEKLSTKDIPEYIELVNNKYKIIGDRYKGVKI